MRRLALLVFSISTLWAQAPAVVITSVDSIGASNARINFTVTSWTGNGALDNLQARFIASPGVCAGGTGGTVQTITSSGRINTFLRSPMAVVIGGMNASTTYNVCIEATTNNFTDVSHTSTSITTTADQDLTPHDTLKFDSSYPDTGALGSMPVCSGSPSSSLNAQGYCKVTLASGCSDIMTQLDYGVHNQAAQGTIILIPTPGLCNGSTIPLSGTGIHSIIFTEFSPDILAFGANGVDTSADTITFGGHTGLGVNDMIVWGQRGFLSPPTTSSCAFGTGFYAGQQFQVETINTGGSGDVITLKCFNNQAHVDITSTGSSSTNFGFEFAPLTLTAGTCPSKDGQISCNYWDRSRLKWIILRSAASDSELPSGNARLTPEYCTVADKCPTISDPAGNGTTAWMHLGNQDGNVHLMLGKIRIGPGIEWTMDSNPPTPGVTSNIFVIDTYATNIVIDRNYLHGQGYPNAKWGGPSAPASTISGSNVSFRGNYIDNMINWKPNPSAVDGNTSFIFTGGPGPYQIENNWWEGAGILIHYDEGDTTKLIKQNCNTIRNTFNVPLKFMYGNVLNTSGQAYSQRQPYEHKACQGILYEGNQSISNFAENSGSANYAEETSVATPVGITDSTIRYNTFHSGPMGIQMATLIDGGGILTTPSNRYWQHDNLFWDINGTTYCIQGVINCPTNGWFNQQGYGGEGAWSTHNSMLANTGIYNLAYVSADGHQSGFRSNDNFLNIDNSFGFAQDGDVQFNDCSALATAEAFIACRYSGAQPGQVKGNVFSSATKTNGQLQTNFPTLKNTNAIPATPNDYAAMKFRRFTGTTDATTTNDDFRLLSGSGSFLSPYASGGANHASDGTSVGPDINALNAAEGRISAYSIPAGQITSTSAHVKFFAPDNVACPVDVSMSRIPTIGVIPTRYADSGNAPGARDVALASPALTTHTTYYARIQCVTEQPILVFATH